MTRLNEIENAVRALSDDDLAEFRNWFAEFDAHRWDKQFEQDAKSGKLDWLAEEAIGDLKEGCCKDI